MPAITTREDFIENCLRALGKPVINIDVTPEQLSDRVDDALDIFAKYHFDGTQHVYFKHQITDQDKVNRYITLPDNILGAVKIFPFYGMSFTGNDMFDIRYQIAINDLYSLTHTSIVPYVMTMTHINALQEILVGRIPIRYNKLNQRLYLDTDWNTLQTGHYLVVEAFEVIDPEESSKMWNDTWLKRYTRALIKRQWAENISKFANMTMPGGIVLNGAQLYQQAQEDIEKYEQELEDKYFNPVLDQMA